MPQRTLGRSFVQPGNVENTGAAPTHFKVSSVSQSHWLSRPRVLYIPFSVRTNGTGEIISGRVIAGGLQLSNAIVTAYRVGGGTYTARTDTNGIYALAAIPSASQYTVSVSATNFVSVSTNCATGSSINGAMNCGNIWGENFSLLPGNNPPLIMLQPRNQSFVDLSGVASFSVTAIGKAPLAVR